MKRGDKVRIISHPYSIWIGLVGTLVGKPPPYSYFYVNGDGWYVMLDDPIEAPTYSMPAHTVIFFTEKELEVINDHS